MIEKLIEAAIPTLLRKIEDIPHDQKIAFAGKIGELCVTYEYGDIDRFVQTLGSFDMPSTWKAAIIAALWKNENQT